MISKVISLIERDSISQQTETLNSRIAQLEEELEREKSKSSSLKKNLNDLEHKYSTISKYLPLNNIFHSFALWMKVIEEAKEVQKLNSESDSKEENIHQLQKQLESSQSNCGALFNKNAELETKV